MYEEYRLGANIILVNTGLGFREGKKRKPRQKPRKAYRAGGVLRLYDDKGGPTHLRFMKIETPLLWLFMTEQGLYPLHLFHL